MLVSGTVVIMVLGSAMTALIVVSAALAIWDKREDSHRRHWKPAESSAH
ncbi:hypothetical protein GCM10011613_36560 [Cellvibrio zantedeschiae]|uniref:Uncharacterized protein n=1 Tax=Cellvibrio zantedeschiae TaxID=1237077 RepID=A0ABQ3BAI6_9GAMM|nr:hypothetical protein [Cellvibrio zantedeschiae]GGY88201.1 hypothetical protein GCM10011613_36560 [Cellvibrio zantedeschiae]